MCHAVDYPLHLMGSYWWLWLVGAAMWGVFIWAGVSSWRHRNNRDPNSCPSCGHTSTVDGCGVTEDYSGWVSDVCDCEDPYHRGAEQAAPRQAA